MSAATPDDLARLQLALDETLAAIEQIREGAGDAPELPLVLADAIRGDRPAESIPMLEQEAADLRRDIRAMEAELARQK